MSDAFVECFNCGRANPEWAQVCRACGVPLRHGDVLVTPAGRIPTDRDSLLSIAAALGTILIAVVLGLLVSGMNPIDPSIGQNRATPSPTPTRTPRATPIATDTPIPTPSATPALPGTLAIGTELGEDGLVVEPVDTFTPGMNFAHSITMPTPFGVESLGEQVVHIAEDGTEEEIQNKDAPGSQVAVSPDATRASAEVPAATLISLWGPGLYELRVYAGDTLLATGRFTLSEGG